VDPICLLVAGVVRATVPAADIDVAWRHSVQRTRWEEHYRADGDALVLTEARVEGTGAGMEPPPEATLADGVWTWRPQRRLPEVRLTQSGFAADYTVCWAGGCQALAALVPGSPDGTVVTIRPCATAGR
jgi:hypothetical protein